MYLFFYFIYFFIFQGNTVSEEKEYRRVAVVEDFFNIIYGVHVEMEGRAGKHAGQKRTYRAVSTEGFLDFWGWGGG